MAAKKDPKNNLKNKSKAEGGWCTDDLYFDEEGCLYVANKALADAIESSMDAWKNRLKIYRDAPPVVSTAVERDYPGGVLAASAGGDRRVEPASAGVPQALRRDAKSAAGDPETSADVRTLALPLDATGSGDAGAGTPANMMCPCAPEP